MIDGRAGGVSRGIRLAALLLIPLLSAAACGPPAAPLQPLPAVPDGGPASFRATAEAAWRQGALKRRGRIALAYRDPDALRVELIDPTGGIGLALISAGDGAITIDTARHSYRRYRDGASALEALVGLPLPPERLAGALLGPAPGAPTGGRIPIGAGEVQLGWERDAGSSPPAPPRTTEFRPMDRKGVLRVTLSDLRFETPDPDLFRLDPPTGFQSEMEEPDGAPAGSPR